MVAKDWKAFRARSFDTFDLEPVRIQTPRLAHKYYDERSEFHSDPLQQFLGTLQTDPTQIQPNPITMASPKWSRYSVLDVSYAHLVIFFQQMSCPVLGKLK